MIMYADIDDLLDEAIEDNDLDTVLDIPGAAAAEERESQRRHYTRHAFYKEEND